MGQWVQGSPSSFWILSVFRKSSSVLPEWQGFLPCIVLCIFSGDNWTSMAWFAQCTNICGPDEHRQTLLASEKVAPWLLSCSICLYTQLLLHWSWDISWFAADGGTHQTTVCAHLQQSGALPTQCTAHHLCSRGYAGTWIWGFACGRHKSSEVSLDHGAQKAPVSGCHLFSHFLMRHSMGTGLVMLEDTYNTNMPLGTLDFAGQAESQFVTLFPFVIFKKSWVDCK